MGWQKTMAVRIERTVHFSEHAHRRSLWPPLSKCQNWEVHVLTFESFKFQLQNSTVWETVHFCEHAHCKSLWGPPPSLPSPPLRKCQNWEVHELASTNIIIVINNFNNSKDVQQCEWLKHFLVPALSEIYQLCWLCQLICGFARVSKNCLRWAWWFLLRCMSCINLKELHLIVLQSHWVDLYGEGPYKLTIPLKDMTRI